MYDPTLTTLRRVPCHTRHKVLLKASGSLSREPFHIWAILFNALTEDCNFSLAPALAFLVAPPDIPSQAKECRAKT